MKLLLITTIATMPLMGYGRPAQESEANPVPQIQAQKTQRLEEGKASQFGILTPNQSPVTCPKGGSFYAYVIQ